MGNGSVQIATLVTEWRAIQAHIGHIDWIQKHRE